MLAIDTSWREAIDDYLTAQRAAGYPAATQETRRQHLQHLARRIGVEPWQVTAEQLVEWCGAQEWSPSTRRSRRTTFQSFYRWAKVSGRRHDNPAKTLPKVRQPLPAPRPIPNRVYREALVLADADEQLWLELAYDHGLRRGEIAVIHSRDLVDDLLGDSLVVHGKGNRDRTIPLTPKMADKLRERVRERGAGYLFAGDVDGHISPRWLGKRVNRLFEGEWTMHPARHNAGTRWNRQGGLLVTQRLLGHASVATTQVYCAVDDGELRETLLAAAS